MDAAMFRLFSLGGIAVEVLGALWLAYAAYRGHKDNKNSIVHQLHWGLQDGDRGDPLDRLSVALQEIAGEFQGIAMEQWRAQAVGFALLAAGLALQFVGVVGT